MDRSWPHPRDRSRASRVPDYCRKYAVTILVIANGDIDSAEKRGQFEAHLRRWRHDWSRGARPALAARRDCIRLGGKRQERANPRAMINSARRRSSIATPRFSWGPSWAAHCAQASGGRVTTAQQVISALTPARRQAFNRIEFLRRRSSASDMTDAWMSASLATFRPLRYLFRCPWPHELTQAQRRTQAPQEKYVRSSMLRDSASEGLAISSDPRRRTVVSSGHGATPWRGAAFQSCAGLHPAQSESCRSHAGTEPGHPGKNPTTWLAGRIGTA